MASGLVRVLIADDQPEFRDAAAMMIDLIEPFKVVGSFDDAESAIAFARQEQVDLVLIDINMPGIGGIEGAAQLRQLDAGIRVILMSTFDSNDLPISVVRSDVAYIHKAALNAETLLKAWQPVEQPALAYRELNDGRDTC